MPESPAAVSQMRVAGDPASCNVKPGLIVERISVGPEIVDITVRSAGLGAGCVRTDETLAQRLLLILPGLSGHTCENDAGVSFVEEIGNTELPHLFEHIVLELMAQSGSPRCLRGRTAWNFASDGRGVFRISLEYDDDLVCLGAVKCACALLGHLLDGSPCPQIEEHIERLKILRMLPAVDGRCTSDRQIVR